MEKDNIQKELFDDFKQPRKQPKRFGQLFQQADFGVNLDAERLVFVSIGIIMLLVISFALGVERGKAISAGLTPEKDTVVAQPTAQPRVAVSAPTQAIQTKAVNAPADMTLKDKAQLPAVKKAQALNPPQVADDKSKPYTIVAAAFSKEPFAAAEVSRMKAGGIEAFVYHSEPYYLACVGAFANKESAQKILSKVRQTHRDAYVRLK